MYLLGFVRVRLEISERWIVGPWLPRVDGQGVLAWEVLLYGRHRHAWPPAAHSLRPGLPPTSDPAAFQRCLIRPTPALSIGNRSLIIYFTRSGAIFNTGFHHFRFRSGSGWTLEICVTPIVCISSVAFNVMYVRIKILNYCYYFIRNFVSTLLKVTLKLTLIVLSESILQIIIDSWIKRGYLAQSGMATTRVAEHHSSIRRCI